MDITEKDLERMFATLNKPLNFARRDYHWENEAEFDREFGVGLMASNIPKMKDLVGLAYIGYAMLELFGGAKTSFLLDSYAQKAHNDTKEKANVDLQRHRTEERDASEGRPDESVSETLREPAVPSVYREAIARPERTWSGFARADDLRTQTEVPRARSRQEAAVGWSSGIEETMAKRRYKKMVSLDPVRDYFPSWANLDLETQLRYKV